jgi:arylsulfatase A-like enzyme
MYIIGHADRYSDYKKKLQTYDDYIQILVNDLKRLGLYEKTIIFVTTDHGRGSKFIPYAFKGHGPEWYLAHSHNAWATISVPPSMKARFERYQKSMKSHFNQRDIRPLIEALMIPTF